MSEHARFLHVRAPYSRKRWVFMLLASFLFHWMTIEWANGNLVFPMQTSSPESVMSAHLRPAAASKAAPRPKPAKPIPPARPPVVRPDPPAAPPLHAPAIETAAPAAPTDTAPENRGIAGAESDSGESASPVEPAGNPESPASDMQADLPPSAELKYDVQAQKKGLTYYGTGTIQWQTDGSRYAITGKAKAAFFTVLEFKSEGEVDQAGIAPILYAERTGNRAETNTHFHRERNTISFSASTLSYPRVGGEQDRASIIWQLAATGRARPELFKPGEELYIFVAGVRNAAPWRIYIIGEEEVQLDTGTVKAWHVKSVPQQGGYEKTFDIWYASGYEWYPVKLRQTEVGGDYLELSLSNLLLAQQ